MGNWVKRTAIILMCVAMAFSAAACNSKQKEKEEAEKAKQEQIEQENQAQANAFVGAVEALPEELKLKDETAVAGARELYDALTDEQKEIVPSDAVTKLENAERTIEELKEKKAERDAEKKENKKAARQAEDVISGIPDNVTLDAENAIIQARAEYNQLTDAQKKYVSQKSIDRLTNAEGRIIELKEAEQKKAEEAEKKKTEKEKKKAEKKKAEKKAEKKKSEKKKDSGKKKEEKKQDKYSIAKKYIGKKASALIAAIGKPNKKKKNANCATDGEEYIYYYDGFYVGVLSQDMDSPLIVQNVTKN